MKAIRRRGGGIRAASLPGHGNRARARPHRLHRAPPGNDARHALRAHHAPDDGERMGRSEGSTTLIPLPLSRQEIADLLGTTLETAIRLMSRWQKESVVVTAKDGFIVPDIAALRNIAG